MPIRLLKSLIIKILLLTINQNDVSKSPQIETKNQLMMRLVHLKIRSSVNHINLMRAIGLDELLQIRANENLSLIPPQNQIKMKGLPEIFVAINLSHL